MREFGSSVVRFLFLLATVSLVAGCHSSYRQSDRAFVAGAPELGDLRHIRAQGVCTPFVTYGDEPSYGVSGRSTADAGVEAPAAPAADQQVVVELAAMTETSQPAEQRILIYTAGLEIAATDINASLAKAQKIAEDSGGYLQAMSSESITLRVPAQQFSAVLDKIQALGQTLSKKIEALDVTDEYVDLKLRLKNAEAMRERLLEILGKANTVKDMLEVERELSRIREEIERIKGRLAVLEKKVAFSTIEVTFMRAAAAKATGHRPVTPFPWLDGLGVETVLGITR